MKTCNKCGMQKSEHLFTPKRRECKACTSLRHRCVRLGITPDEYRRMYKQQEGRCLLCDDEQKVLHIDHCHGSGKVRGLLCNNCNVALGLLRDSPRVLLRAINYLTA